MRDLMQIGLSGEKARLLDLRGEWEIGAQKFAAYLEHYWPKRRTRHAVLRPVAEIVKLAAKPQITPTQAAGRAFRIHEMAQESRPVSAEATKKLEDAVSTFFGLMQRCPVHLRKTVSDRVLDHVYLLTRKADQKFWSDWGAWVQTKYTDLGTLNAAWGSSYETWDKVRLKKDSDAANRDFDQFKKARRVADEITVESIVEAEL